MALRVHRVPLVNKKQLPVKSDHLPALLNNLYILQALGCVLYEMCSLKPPFNAQNLVSLLFKIIKGEYEVGGYYKRQIRLVCKSHMPSTVTLTKLSSCFIPMTEVLCVA